MLILFLAWLVDAGHALHVSAAHAQDVTTGPTLGGPGTPPATTGTGAGTGTGTGTGTGAAQGNTTAAANGLADTIEKRADRAHDARAERDPEHGQRLGHQ